MHCVFIHGPVASGKLTVATALSSATGLPLFHNHLAVDAALSLFEFGTPGFVALREAIWLAAFKQAADAGQSFIFTFHPEASVPPSFIDRAVSAIEDSGGRMLFVALTCSEAAVEGRIEEASRSAFRKLTSLELYRSLRDQDAFSFPALPLPHVSLATDLLSPVEAATAIGQLLESAPAPIHLRSARKKP